MQSGVLGKKSRLRQSDLFSRVYISPDLTAEERVARGILVRKLKEEKERSPGKSFRIKGGEVVEIRSDSLLNLNSPSKSRYDLTPLTTSPLQIRSDSLIRSSSIDGPTNSHNEPFCPSLNSLRLNSNELKNIPLWMLRAFPFLEDLNLSKNSIQYLPDQPLGLETLSDLDLSVNQITKIPNLFFKDMSNLKSLDMSGNQVTALFLSCCNTAGDQNPVVQT
eukprot:sb/3469851/